MSVVNINETNQLKGIDNEILKQVASFGTTGGFPAAWDFAWSGGVTADKIDSTNSNLSSPLIRFSKTSSGSDSQVNVLPNDIQVISDTDWTMLEETSDNRITIITCVKNHPEVRLCVQAMEKI